MAATKLLPGAQLTSSGRPVLQLGEVESTLLSSVDLESEENTQFPLFKSGVLILTTHRLLLIRDSSLTNNSDTNTSSGGVTAVAIPLGAITHIFPPKKSIKKMFASPRVRFQVSTSLEGQIHENGPKSLVLTLVMRGSKSDPDSLYARFWDALRARSWEISGSSGSSVDLMTSSTEGSGGVVRTTTAMVGVSGILRREQEMWESTDKSLQDAFQDLNALMSKAKEMVMLAEKMRLKLLSGPANDEEMTSKQEMQDWMLSVGIASPVTKESAGALYHQQLSRQLADFVKLPLERAGGMIALVDVYCLFNRARGTELISPEDLLRACAMWEKFDVPVMLRKFDSGVMVIQSKSHSDEEVFERIKSLVSKPDALRTGISPSDAAITLGIAPAMAKEHLLTAESKGLLCRDISPEGFRFFRNLFNEIDSSDVYLVKDHGIYRNWVSIKLNLEMEADKIDIAEKLFKESVKCDIIPDSKRFSTMVRCYCKKNEPLEAKMILDQMVENGFTPHVVIFTDVINSLCVRGRVKIAFEVFEVMSKTGCEPNVQTYNCLMKGLCYVGKVEEAFKLLVKMKKSLKKPDIYTYTAVMDGFCKVGRSDEGMELLEEALADGLKPNVVTFNTLFNGYCREGRSLEGVSLLKRMKERDCQPDHISYNTVLHGLLKWGKVLAALKVYKEMVEIGFEVDERIMNTLLRGICRRSGTNEELFGDVEEVLERIKSSGSTLYPETHGLVIQTLSTRGTVEKALSSLHEMMRIGNPPRLNTFNVVIKALCSEGRVDDAILILVLMSEAGELPSRTSYKLMISEFNRQGRLLDAGKLYAAAIKRGVSPCWQPRKLCNLEDVSAEVRP
ncbi:hypothetical protein IFM89_003500 [Coptis chinensis]|uniref:ESCRT-II complex subunit VPS36 n=1 Tax=Coptis chinensis TaxID=261450 RepID=A0A835HCT3_9MAGN|nr:hypothetical protein IFM89_003500 [Coptis chinensis]